MAKQALLIASVGQTDLQVVVEKDGIASLAEIGKPAREFHEGLLDGTIKFIFDPAIRGRLQESGPRASKPRVERTSQGIEARDGWQIIKTKNNEIILFPAKLSVVVDKIIEKYEEHNVRAVLLLGTHRNRNFKFSVSEPIAAQKLIAQWLAGAFKLTAGAKNKEFGLGKAGWLNFLDGTMESPGPEEGDFPVNREGMGRIDDAIRQLRKEAAENGCLNDIEVIVSTGGGIPHFRESILACARLHFGSRKVGSWLDPDEVREGGKLRPSEKEPPAPTESFRVREHAMNLLRSGDFAGAYAAAKELESHERDWVKKLECAASYFRGNLSRESKWLADMPSLKRLVEEDTPRCLRVGMRVEAALRGQRLPEAVAWTSTFFDAARLDFVESLDFVEKVDDLKETLTHGLGNQAIPNALTHSSDRYQGLNRVSITPEKYEYDFRSNAWWSVLNNEFLQRYYNILRTPRGESALSPYDLRNLTIHGVVDPNVSRKIRSIFQEANLWCSQEPYFLGSDIVDNLLYDLGVGEPAQLYDDLVRELCTALRSFQIT